MAFLKYKHKTNDGRIFFCPWFSVSTDVLQVDRDLPNFWLDLTEIKTREFKNDIMINMSIYVCMYQSNFV